MQKMLKRLLSLCLIAGLMLTNIPVAGAANSGNVPLAEGGTSVNWSEMFSVKTPAVELPADGTYAPNRLLVTRVAVAAKTRAVPFANSSIESTDTLFALPISQDGQSDMVSNSNEEAVVTCTAVNLKDGSDMLSVMKELARVDGVVAVEVDRIYTVNNQEGESFTPASDPLEEQQTWLNFMGATKAQDTLVSKDKKPGDGVVVAVLDTGIASNHPDLKDQIEDGGKQFAFNKETGKLEISAVFEDGSGHGTHVSGIIAGAKNGTGITGVAYGAKILPIKVLNDQGSGYTSGIISGIMYAAGIDDKTEPITKGKPLCDIINMSLGGDGKEPDTAYETAIKLAREQGIFVVVAAGNSEMASGYPSPKNISAPYTSPAYVTEAFTVMAMGETPQKNGDYLTNFSNWDSDPYVGTEFTVMAPGSNMLSAAPGDKVKDNSPAEGGRYVRMSGTSMASPAVAGAAALVLGANPDYTPADIWAVLATTGKKLQGKTDAEGKVYNYHSVDVAAALNANLEDIKGQVRGRLVEQKIGEEGLSVSGSILVIPMDGSKMPQVKLELRGYDAAVTNVTVTSPDMTLVGDEYIDTINPGTTDEVTLELNEVPTSGTFTTNVTISWGNADGSKDSETLPVKMSVFAAVDGEKIGEGYQHSGSSIMPLWVFEDAVNIELTGDAEIQGAGVMYFGKAGSLNVTGKQLMLYAGHMIDPQLSGNIGLELIGIGSLGVRKQSTISVQGMYGCNVERYNGLTLTVENTIDGSTFSSLGNSTVKAQAIFASTFLNGVSLNDDVFDYDGPLKITVDQPTNVGDGTDEDPTVGFYDNAVIGPLTVVDGEGDPAVAQNCYYLPVSVKTDNPYELGVPEADNKLNCAEGSTVYVEGESEDISRPKMLENCPAFVISTKRVEGVDPGKRNYHLSYRLVSEFSRNPYIAGDLRYESIFGSNSGQKAVDVEWAGDGKSCTYTVYTHIDNEGRDDYYTIVNGELPIQYDFRNMVKNEVATQGDLMVFAEAVENGIDVDWFPIGDTSNATSGKITWGIVGQTQSERDLEPDEIRTPKLDGDSEWFEGVGGVKIPNLTLKEGTQYSFSVEIDCGKGTKAVKFIGKAGCYIPYATEYEDISLRNSSGTKVTELNISGHNRADIKLQADRSFNLKNGLRVTTTLDGKAVTLRSIAPTKSEIFGIAQQDNVAVAEIAPANNSAITDDREVVVFEGENIATLSLRGNNISSQGKVKIELADFFGKALTGENGNPIVFEVDVKTSIGDDDDTDLDNNGTSSTLPDGTLVTTTTNKDGSIQIVYTRPDGVKSTVNTPASGKSATVSIVVPASAEGKNTKVQVPLKNGNPNTTAFLVGADGKEKVIPNSYWKDGVLNMSVKDNANIVIRDNGKEFSDIMLADWFAGDVGFVTSRELFQGVGDNRFEPQQTANRAMLFVVLQRLAGEGSEPKDGETWYSSAMDWAKDSGISDGTAPMANITRQELAVMIYRFASSPEVSANTDKFNDSNQIADWAKEAMSWAVENGILKGDNGSLNPMGMATRAEIAAVLARFVLVS